MIGCRRVRAFLHRDAAALSDAERLVLEEHLQACDGCRRDRARLQMVRQAGAALPARSIGSRGHQRALSRALLEGSRPAAARPRSRLRYALAGSVAVAAVGAALAFAGLAATGDGTSAGGGAPVAADPAGPTGAPPAAPSVPAVPPAPPAASIEAGAVSRDGVPLDVGAEVPADTALHAARGARIVLPAASVAVVAAGELRWSASEHAVYLDGGTIDVEVDPRQRAPVRVVTERFVIEVTGTLFRASPRGVAVQRGSVRVTSRDGLVLAASVRAGETWEVAEPSLAAPAAAGWLARARAAFGAGRFAEAERHADAALDASPSRLQAAEARAVLAECAQALGRLDDAVARYRAIAARFADLPDAEHALFAAARLEASRGRAGSARGLLRHYLDRYPTGRYVDDARRRLGDLR